MVKTSFLAVSSQRRNGHNSTQMCEISQIIGIHAWETKSNPKLRALTTVNNLMKRIQEMGFIGQQPIRTCKRPRFHACF